MAVHHLIASREAEWQGDERLWSGVEQMPYPRRSSWWLVVVAVVLVGLALGWGAA